MAKKIIILERKDYPSDLNFDVVFWLDVTASRQAFYANPSATSQYKLATAEELAAIASGAVVERLEKITFRAGSSLASIQTRLISDHAKYQAEVTDKNPWVRYGTHWDGTSWTAGGVS